MLSVAVVRVPGGGRRFAAADSPLARGAPVMALRNSPTWVGSPSPLSEKTSVVELRTPQAALETIAYVIANPVVAGLVSRGH